MNTNRIVMFFSILTLTILSACGAETEQGAVEGQDSDCICPAVFAPVCGADGNTYSNSCQAACSDVEVVGAGQCPAPIQDCEDSSDCPSGFVCEEVAPECNPLFACPQVLVWQCVEATHPIGCNDINAPTCNWFVAPCGDGLTPKIGNSCSDVTCVDPATCEEPTVPANWTCSDSYYNNNDGCDCECGAYDPDCDSPTGTLYGCDGSYNDGWSCTDDGQCEEEEEGCFCPAVFAPVCGADGNTYSNSCMAACDDVEVVGDGACSEEPEQCICNEIYAPVCGTDGQTYGNECEAECQQVNIAHDGICAVHDCEDSSDCPSGFVCEEVAPECNTPGLACPQVLVWQCVEANPIVIPGTCGDGKPTFCLAEPPVCEDGLVVNFVNHCYGGCVDPDTCLPPVVSLPPEVLPAEWSCNEAYFDANDGCDCECGAYDPDCDNEGALYGCGFGAEGCSADGMCID